LHLAKNQTINGDINIVFGNNWLTWNINNTFLNANFFAYWLVLVYYLSQKQLRLFHKVIFMS
jgi:hypothetical protein